MTLKVYAVSGAPRPWRVVLGLTFKGLDFETSYLEASKQEHKGEAHLSINPRGKVPSLVTEDLTLRDSIAILAWLDRAYPDKPLFGSNADEAAKIWQVTMEACDYLRSAADGLLGPIFFGGATEATPELAAAAKRMRDEFTWLEGLFQDDFLAGSKPTAADAVSFPEVRIAQRAIDTNPDLMASLGFENGLEVFPKLAAWRFRVEAVDGYEKTFPPHWAG